MSGRLKLGPLLDDKPVRLTVELPAETGRLLQQYADALAADTGMPVELSKLVPAIVLRFVTTDRAFMRQRKGRRDPGR